MVELKDLTIKESIYAGAILAALCCISFVALYNIYDLSNSLSEIDNADCEQLKQIIINDYDKNAVLKYTNEKYILNCIVLDEGFRNE